MSEHSYFLQRATTLAKKSIGFCVPNPMVGAIVVKDGKIISEGYHEGAGNPHAEVVALKKLAPDVAQGATLYVTLEPCCIYGRTPPCTDLIIQMKLDKIIYGYQDPNPDVAGRGIKLLQAAGISCEHHEVAAINELYKAYQYWWSTGMPWVQAKLALSADNMIAGKGGVPVNITNDSVNQFTHQLRQGADVILTSAKTIINDNPQLNVRINNSVQGKVVCVIDSALLLKPSAKIFQTSTSVIIFHDEKYDNKSFARVACKMIPIKKISSGLSLQQILKSLAQLGFHKVLLEAGSHLFKSFLDNGLINEAYIYSADKELGHEAYPAGFTKSDLLKLPGVKSAINYGDNEVTQILLNPEIGYTAR